MKKIRYISWFMALGLLLAISISANADDWITHYYEHPTPERFVTEVRTMSKAGFLAKENSAAPIAAFLGRVMAANPSQVEGWLNQLDVLEGADKNTLLWAANLSFTKESLAYIQRQPDANKYRGQTDIRTVEPNDASILDMLWGDFFATGEEIPIRRIVYALNYDKYSGALDRFKTSKKTQRDREEAIRESVFNAARWSLESNIQQHNRVAEIVERIYKEGQTTRSEQLWLSAILAHALPNKYEFTQIKPGEWAFKQK